MADDTVTQNPSIILERQHVDIQLTIGDIPGTPPSADEDDMFGGTMDKPPIDPGRALKAVLKNGALAATCHAVGEGTAGLGYDITPRFKGDVNDPNTWPDGAAAERDKLQAFMQVAFVGDSVTSLREGFYRQEHDRVILGWGGVGVIREDPKDMIADVIKNGRKFLPPPTKWLCRFEASGAQFTKPDKKATMTPVPVALEDGRIVWVNMPRYFRRIRFKSSGGKSCWYKEFGDWRAMDSRTGKYSTGVKYTPPKEPFQPGKCTPGQLPPGAVPAIEVMHWCTSFPGVAPYGISGWHSEINAIDASNEHIKLLLEYLKSGLHSVILAAANRKFDSGTAEAAMKKIDELGRGRKGLGSIITLELIPGDSATAGGGGTPFDKAATGDRGRIILHELSTKLPQELLDDTLSSTLASRISEAERIPALLLGRSDAYNFATAAAAWTVVNRLRFMPHHVGREAFLDNFLIQMGIVNWRLTVRSPEWEERDAISTVAQTVGTFGGMTINRAQQILNEVIEADFKPIEAWWGNIPLKFVEMVLASPDPQAALDALDLPDKPQIPGAEKLVVKTPVAPTTVPQAEPPPDVDQGSTGE